MAIVAKWLTHRIVAPALVGSIPIYRPLCRCGGIGRRAGLKIQCPLRTYRFDPDHRYHLRLEFLVFFCAINDIMFYYINIYLFYLGGIKGTKDN